MRQERALETLSGVVLWPIAVWLLFSLAHIPPFDKTVLQDEARGELIVVAAIACVLFAIAAVRYWVLYLRRPAVVLVSVITAWALLAEAAAATAIGRPWQLTWPTSLIEANSASRPHWSSRCI